MSITLGKLKRELKLIPDLGKNRKKMFNQLCRIHNCNYNAKVSASLLGGAEGRIPERPPLDVLRRAGLVPPEAEIYETQRLFDISLATKVEDRRKFFSKYNINNIILWFYPDQGKRSIEILWYDDDLDIDGVKQKIRELNGQGIKVYATKLGDKQYEKAFWQDDESFKYNRLSMYTVVEIMPAMKTFFIGEDGKFGLPHLSQSDLVFFVHQSIAALSCLSENCSLRYYDMKLDNMLFSPGKTGLNNFYLGDTGSVTFIGSEGPSTFVTPQMEDNWPTAALGKNEFEKFAWYIGHSIIHMYASIDASVRRIAGQYKEYYNKKTTTKQQIDEIFKDVNDFITTYYRIHSAEYKELDEHGTLAAVRMQQFPFWTHNGLMHFAFLEKLGKKNPKLKERVWKMHIEAGKELIEDFFQVLKFDINDEPYDESVDGLTPSHFGKMVRVVQSLIDYEPKVRENALKTLKEILSYSGEPQPSSTSYLCRPLLDADDQVELPPPFNERSYQLAKVTFLNEFDDRYEVLLNDHNGHHKGIRASVLKNKIGEGTYGYIFPLTYTYNKKEHGAVIKIGKIKQERYGNVNKELKQIYEFKRCREKECHAHFLIPSLPGIGLYHIDSATTAPNTPGPTQPSPAVIDDAAQQAEAAEQPAETAKTGFACALM